MGNQINTPGWVKFYWTHNQVVESKYHTIHEIPVMTIDKKQTFISEALPNNKIAILHFDDSKKSAEVQNKLKKFRDLNVYAFPNQNSKQDFQQIKANNGESLGKMVMSGQRCHPLFKYLKKNCPQVYNYKTNSSGNKLRGIGMFIIEKNKEEQVRYYNQQNINKFIDSTKA